MVAHLVAAVRLHCCRIRRSFNGLRSCLRLRRDARTVPHPSRQQDSRIPIKSNNGGVDAVIYRAGLVEPARIERAEAFSLLGTGCPALSYKSNTMLCAGW